MSELREGVGMTFGDVFAGIGGFSLGLKRAGLTCRWQIEVDPYCRSVLERHWPDVPRRGDVRLVEPAALEPVDALVGGFPCQDVSKAGKGAGVDGRRSGLWRELMRLVRGLRPRWLVIENVPALRVRGADVVLADLEATGYDVWPLVVAARYVGAPYPRDRVFIVCRVADGDGDGLQGERAAALPARAFGDEPHGRGERGRWPSRPGEPQYEWEAERAIESRVGGAATGIPGRLALPPEVADATSWYARHPGNSRHALRALGNCVVPQVAEVIGRVLIELDANHEASACRGD